MFLVGNEDRKQINTISVCIDGLKSRIETIIPGIKVLDLARDNKIRIILTSDSSYDKVLEEENVKTKTPHLNEHNKVDLGTFIVTTKDATQYPGISAISPISTKAY